MLQIINHIPDICLALVCPCPSYAAEPRTEPIAPDMASPVLRRGEGSQPWPAGNTHPKRGVSPGGCQPSLLQECIAGSFMAWCPPGPKSLCKAAFLSVSPQPVWVYEGWLSSGAGLRNFLCWNSWDSCLPFSPACWRSSEWSHNNMLCQPLLPSSSCLQTVRGRTLSSTSLMGVLNGVISLSISPCVRHHWLASGWSLWHWS